MKNVNDLEKRLLTLRKSLINHPVYQAINNINALRIFMEHHVFAVWDFMSLLKTLQQRLCCVTVPWFPPEHSLGCRLVNEIVLGEESDEDGRGGFASHFQLYYEAMVDCGANTVSIDNFLKTIREGKSIETALSLVSDSVNHFVSHTFNTIKRDSIIEIASSFTFGREDLLPDLFRRIVEELNHKTYGNLEKFRYYLDRHIGLDEEEHGPMANKLITFLCGTNENNWKKTENAAVEALELRIELWDGVLLAIERNNA